jgi:hypothetical protein
MAHNRSDTARLTEALRATESALRDLLAAEAQRSVDEAIGSLKMESAPLRLRDVEVEVIIKNASFETVVRDVAGGQVHQRPARARRARTAGRPAKGRPASQIRLALLGAFEESETEFDTDALRTHLKRQGLEPTSDNLHQHLGRLVRAGAIERAGRGRYRRPA